ncbi:hypothetical protein [Photobacterium damselae]|uniref:hypothetical protein n=1 Tax=Photobacterium damselae TaxID=38293 RepID=UPI0003073A4C|nr:hypothetical protein [Photobacterium damselae]PSW79347.1 hypothetical protein CTN07_20705 [Photobacterium damselae]
MVEAALREEIIRLNEVFIYMNTSLTYLTIKIMNRKFELLKLRFQNRINITQDKFGFVSLLSLVRSQYYYPNNYPFTPKEIDCSDKQNK